MADGFARATGEPGVVPRNLVGDAGRHGVLDLPEPHRTEQSYLDGDHDDFGNEVEIWNLVFTQFHRVGDPPDNLRPLPSKNIDTGMGLERTAAALQGVQTNFDIDILRPIVEAAAEVCGVTYDCESDFGRRLRRIEQVDRQMNRGEVKSQHAQLSDLLNRRQTN